MLLLLDGHGREIDHLDLRTLTSYGRVRLITAKRGRGRSQEVD
jgi:hypothetical protein